MEILNQKISYYPKLFESGSKQQITINEVLLKIKSSIELKELIEKIRQIDDKKERNELKKKLPAVTFAGLFSYRKKEHLQEASGIAVIDLDIKNIQDKDKIKEIKDDIKRFPFVLFMFQSPSGGLKIGCRIPKVNSDKEYKLYYLALSKEFDKYSDYLDNDSNTKDIDRLCFLSYDPDLYLNEFCIEYTNKVDEDKVDSFESLYKYEVFVDAKRMEEILRDKTIYKLIIADPEEMA
ncbi:MAG: BT4734/BF3469 family protein, partial [Promethearchaeota archaeon]